MDQRKRFALILIVFFALFTASPVAEGAGEEKYPIYDDYRKIPGVTEEEIASIEEIKANQDVFVFGMNYSTEVFVNSQGELDGFSRLFCEWMSELFDIEVELRVVEWDELIFGLENGEIDFTGELTATVERQRKYFMTGPIAERSLKSFRLMGSEKIESIVAERNVRYAFLEGSTAYGFLSGSSEFPFEYRFVSDYDEVISLLEADVIDAFFEDGTAEAAFDEYENIVVTEYFPLIYAPVSLTTADETLAPFVDVVQKYLDEDAIYHLTGLYNEGHQEYMKNKFLIQLDDVEREYVKKHIDGNLTIPIALEYDNYPYSFYNQQEEEWQGIVVDVLEEISELTGLTFESLNEPGDDWPILLSMLDKGEVALISELIPSSERKGFYLWPDTPYAVDYYALISKEEHEDIRINQILYSSVGLAENTAYEEVFLDWFPHHQNVVTYPSTDEAFVGLENDEVEFVMASRNLLLSVTNYLEKPGYKANIVFDHPYGSRFGLNIEEETLCSIISRAQNFVDTEGITNRWTRKTFDYRSKMAAARIPYLVGAAVLLVVIAVLMFILFLRKQKTSRALEEIVHERTMELEVQTEAAKVASQAKGAFLARMSHEIRTPLNAIIGMAQVADMVPEQPEKVKKANGEILTASEHLLDVLNDVLDMSKIESGKFTLAEEPFDLSSAMDEVAVMIEQRCHEKNILFQSNHQEFLPMYILGDKLRLKQVLINLLGNAVKFTENNGKISFLTELLSEDESQISVRFTISDNGIGISKEQAKHLFMPFEQADSNISVKYGGTGLGLAISQNMVNRMGGNIEVESTLGEGSVFTFLIRFTRTIPLEEQTEEDELSKDFSGKRILVVEDVEINRIVLRELLDGTGLVIEEVENGQDAVKIFAASQLYYYDLIFMDIQMPVKNGYEAAKSIRELNRADGKTVPIVAMTANAYKEDVEKALAAGMDGHIAKPIDLNMVIKVLHQFL